MLRNGVEEETLPFPGMGSTDSPRKVYLKRVLAALNSSQSPEEIEQFANEIEVAIHLKEPKDVARALDKLTTEIILDPMTEADLALMYFFSGDVHNSLKHEVFADARLRLCERKGYLTPSELAIIKIQEGISLAYKKNQIQAINHLAAALCCDFDLQLLHSHLKENIIAAIVNINTNLAMHFNNSPQLSTVTQSIVTNASSVLPYIKRAGELLPLEKFFSTGAHKHVRLLDYSMAYWLLRSRASKDPFPEQTREKLAQQYKEQFLQLKEEIKQQEARLESVTKAFKSEIASALTQLNPQSPPNILQEATNLMEQVFTLYGSAKWLSLREYLLKASKLCTLSYDAYCMLGQALVANKQFEEAITLLKSIENNAVISHGPIQKWHMVKNTTYLCAYLELNQLDLALHYAIQSILEDTTIVLDYTNNFFKRALVDFVTKLHKLSSPSKKLDVKREIDLAHRFYKQKNYQKAKEHIELAIANQPEDASLYFFRGETLRAMAKDEKDFQLALFDFYLAQWLFTKKHSQTLSQKESQLIAKHIPVMEKKIAELNEIGQEPPAIPLPKITLPDEACTIIKKLKEAGYLKTFAVGGIVRDALMGLDASKSDIDIVTQATPEQLRALFPLQEYPSLHFAKDGKLLQLKINNRQMDIWSSTHLQEQGEIKDILKKDALFRDFNINAFYADEEGNVFDPCEQIESKKLDTLSDPNALFETFPICMVRAIYLSHKLGIPMAKRVANALSKNIQHLSSIDLFAIRPLFNKIVDSAKSPEIMETLDKLAGMEVLFPYFKNHFPSRKILECLTSADENNPMTWVFLHLLIESVFSEETYNRVHAIADPVVKLSELEKLEMLLKNAAESFKKEPYYKSLFIHDDIFEKRFKDAIEANKSLNRLMIEKQMITDLLIPLQEKMQEQQHDMEQLKQENGQLKFQLEQQQETINQQHHTQVQLTQQLQEQAQLLHHFFQPMAVNFQPAHPCPPPQQSVSYPMHGFWHQPHPNLLQGDYQGPNAEP